MADTVNFGWTKPTEDGSTGSWDTILNTALDDIDADLKIVKDNADDVLAENLAFPILPANMHGFPLGNDADDIGNRTINAIQLDVAGSLDYVIPIHGLAPGMRITGFKSRGQAPTGTQVNVELRNQDASGGDGLVSSHSHGTSLGTLTKTGLSFDVPVDQRFYFFVTLDRGVSGVPVIMWVQPTVVRV